MKTLYTVLLTLVSVVIIAVLLFVGYEIRTSHDSDFEDRMIASTILGETMFIHVRLPWDYETDRAKHYPVVVKFDGDSHLKWHDATLQTMVGLGWEDAIVVGISNGRKRRNLNLTPTGWPQDNENPDVLGEGDRFLDFIETELMPYMRTEYRTNEDITLSGYSRGGLLVLYAYATRPAAYAGFMAFSPAAWREDDRLSAIFADQLDPVIHDSKKLFMSLGTEENPKMTRGYRAARAALTASGVDAQSWMDFDARTGTHQTTAYLSMAEAYDFILERRVATDVPIAIP